VRRFLARLANFFRREQAEREMAREISAHLALLEEEFEQRGLPAEAAKLAALRSYGGVEQSKELHRDARSFVWLEQSLKDLQYAVRGLAVDDAWEGLRSKPGQTTETQLEQVYSRGLGPYFLTGTDHQAVVRGRAPRHRGLLIGRVIRVLHSSVVIDAGRNLKPGDGVVFDAADWRSPQQPEEGGRVFQVIAHPDRTLELQFGNDAIDFSRIRPGDLLWRTHDPDSTRSSGLTHTQPLQSVNKRSTFTSRPAKANLPCRAGGCLISKSQSHRRNLCKPLRIGHSPRINCTNNLADSAHTL